MKAPLIRVRLLDKEGGSLKKRYLSLFVCFCLALLSGATAGCGSGRDAGDESLSSHDTAEAGRSSPAASRNAAEAAGTIALPPAGRLYHGVFPSSGSETGESGITPAGVESYEQAAGKRVAWVYFSHDWYQGRAFPHDKADWIRERGSVPYIRLMLRSSDEQDVAEPLYTLDAIIGGEFDQDLGSWFADAREYGSPLILEFGTEVNGEWFSWNGSWNGGGETEGYGDDASPDGPERFRDAYRHIISIAREEGAANIVWVFHFDRLSVPDDDWNSVPAYYPGDEWIDWIGVSVYGPVEPGDNEVRGFRDLMDEAYSMAEEISNEKPVVISEFGATDGSPYFDQADWGREALTEITSGRWPRLIGFSWWNEKWQNDDDPRNDSDLMLQDNPELAAAFVAVLGTEPGVLDHAIVTAP